MKTPQGFSLLEILIAVAILGFCFVPILTQSLGSLAETEQSQETLLARHFLLDLVERYRGSSLVELSTLHPPTFAPPPLGTDQDTIAGDALLNDVKNIQDEMAKAAQASGVLDPGAAGFNQCVSLGKMIKLTREVYFQDNGAMADGGVTVPNPPHSYSLTCKVRWMPRNSTTEKTLQLVDVLVRTP